MGGQCIDHGLSVAHGFDFSHLLADARESEASNRAGGFALWGLGTRTALIDLGHGPSPGPCPRPVSQRFEPGPTTRDSVVSRNDKALRLHTDLSHVTKTVSFTADSAADRPKILGDSDVTGAQQVL